jgi:hypothetical protein
MVTTLCTAPRAAAAVQPHLCCCAAYEVQACVQLPQLVVAAAAVADDLHASQRQADVRSLAVEQQHRNSRAGRSGVGSWSGTGDLSRSPRVCWCKRCCAFRIGARPDAQFVSGLFAGHDLNASQCQTVTHIDGGMSCTVSQVLAVPSKQLPQQVRFTCVTSLC